MTTCTFTSACPVCGADVLWTTTPSSTAVDCDCATDTRPPTPTGKKAAAAGDSNGGQR